MRITIATIALCVPLLLGAQADDTTGASSARLVELGITSFRAGDFSQAVTDLEAAAEIILAPEQMQKYVSSGTLPDLDRLEKALVYLAVAQSRMGREEQAREVVLRLITAERIALVYAGLILDPEVAEFEAIVVRVVPGASLPRNVSLAVVSPQAGMQIVSQPAAPQLVESVPAPLVSNSQAPANATPPTEEALAAQLDAERAARQKVIEEMVAQERARIERAAEQRIAAVQREAEARIEAARREAEERIAAERAAAVRAAEQRLAAMQQGAGDGVSMRARREYLTRLREAWGHVAKGQFGRANDIYKDIVDDANVPREVLAEAAVGLYQTGAFRDAVRVFEKLGTFSRGDEDLRYYYAVALYETGNYPAAQRELACALPFIQVTSDVTRYRNKIEQTASPQAMR